MAFLDNSGDIILDAVLTDAGRYRLAQGDGTFNIVKFALADDEINYGLYNKAHPSGSAYYDLDILQTPVFEAFTNNASSMKNQLVSYSSTNLLYLPVMKIVNTTNTCFPNSSPLKDSRIIPSVTSGTIHITVDTNTASSLNVGSVNNYLNGFDIANSDVLRVDQGLDTLEIAKTIAIDPQLRESSFIIEVDNRLCSIYSYNNVEGTLSFIDDDNKATYLVNINFSYSIGVPSSTDTTADDNVIEGPQGQGLVFKVKASTELQGSSYLFTRLGGTLTNVETASIDDYYYLDSTINVIGATTGTRLSIPVRFIKKQ